MVNNRYKCYGVSIFIITATYIKAHCSGVDDLAQLSFALVLKCIDFLFCRNLTT